MMLFKGEGQNISALENDWNIEVIFHFPVEAKWEAL